MSYARNFNKSKADPNANSSVYTIGSKATSKTQSNYTTYSGSKARKNSMDRHGSQNKSRSSSRIKKELLDNTDRHKELMKENRKRRREIEQRKTEQLIEKRQREQNILESRKREKKRSADKYLRDNSTGGRSNSRNRSRGGQRSSSRSKKNPQNSSKNLPPKKPSHVIPKGGSHHNPAGPQPPIPKPRTTYNDIKNEGGDNESTSRREQWVDKYAYDTNELKGVEVEFSGSFEKMEMLIRNKTESQK